MDGNRQNPNGDDPGKQYHQPFDYPDSFKQYYEQQGGQYNGQPGKNFQYDRQHPDSAPYTAGDARIFSILSYIGLLWLVGLFADRNNPAVKFHVNQGIILTVFEFALAFALGITESIIRLIFTYSFVFTGIGTLICGILSFAGWFLVFAFCIIGIVHAANERQEPLPFIGTLFTVIH